MSLLGVIFPRGRGSVCQFSPLHSHSLSLFSSFTPRKEGMARLTLREWGAVLHLLEGEFVHKVEFFFTARLSALSHSFISLFAMAIGVMDIFRILWVMNQYYALYFVAQTAHVGHLELFQLTACPFCILVLTFWPCRMLQSLLVCSRLSPESATCPGSPGCVCCRMVLESTIWAPLSLVVTGPSQLPEQATMCDIH